MRGRDASAGGGVSPVSAHPWARLWRVRVTALWHPRQQLLRLGRHRLVSGALGLCRPRGPTLGDGPAMGADRRQPVGRGVTRAAAVPVHARASPRGDRRTGRSLKPHAVRRHSNHWRRREDDLVPATRRCFDGPVAYFHHMALVHSALRHRSLAPDGRPSQLTSRQAAHSLGGADRSTVITGDTLATELRGSPDALAGTRTLPGASTSRTLLVSTTAIAVRRRLRLKASF